ncbi:myosin-14 [Galendromus occidentalis]|uniref:Myosin-14 n=1 Tax=Galendromus occidentalis TaxID=34638 RepID=A0AAJ6QSJ1_9ACAR|nr:myosin-14 [Galendromus occidentalis]
MANRGDIARLCANLSRMGVEIKPEELQNLSRTTTFRVMTDFTNAAFLVSPECMNQQLAISLDKYNVNSAASPFIQNRCILWEEALALLSKGGSMIFDFNDLMKPDTKKFNQMLQQMLKYLFYAAKLYDATSDECQSLEELAEEIEKQRLHLEQDKDELRSNEQRIAQLKEAKIDEVFNRAVEQRDESLEKAMRLQNEYAELKLVLEKEQEQLSQSQEQSTAHEHQLSELQDLVVSDPESQVAALEQLRKDSVTKGTLFADREKQLNEIDKEEKSLAEEERRARKILNTARNIGTVVLEFDHGTKQFEKRIADEQKCIVDLQSERDRLQTNVESRNQQVKKMSDQECLKSETVQSLEKEDSVKQHELANEAKLKGPLVSEENRIKQAINEVYAWTEDFEAAGIARSRRKFEEHMNRWSRHCEEVRLLEAECLKTEESQNGKYKKLLSLVEALKTLD